MRLSVVVLTVHRWVTDPMLLTGVSIWTRISTSDLPVHELTFSLGGFLSFFCLFVVLLLFPKETVTIGSASFHFDKAAQLLDKKILKIFHYLLTGI